MNKDLKKPQWRNYPADLGRLPLFLPVKKREFTPRVLHTSWGKITLEGKTLTMFDEDIFITLANMGIKRKIALDYGDSFETIVYQGNLYNIAKNAGKIPGRNTYRMIISSLKALHSIKIKIEADGYKHYDSLLYSFTTRENDPEQKTPIKIVMNAKIAKAFDKIRHLDMDIRAQLSEIGKALHRFLSCHSLTSRFKLETLKASVAPELRNNNFKSYILRETSKLKELGFLESFKYENGVFTFTRSHKQKSIGLPC